jgi:general secretion pathway protein B
MSYILEALRRADAERERGEIPTLRAQVDPLSQHAAEPTLAMQPWVWIVAGGAIGVLVPFVSYLLMKETPRTEGRVPETPIVNTRPQAPTSSPLAPMPAASVVAPAATAAVPFKEAPAPPSGSPASAKQVHKQPRQKSAAGAPAPRAEGASAAAPASRPPTLSELPDEMRRGLPSLAVSGNMYSDRPENRMVIINGQLLRENDALTPELTLEEIRRKSVVLRYRGQRFEVSN